MKLVKPQKLQRGDKVATVSLSWGGAGDESLHWRYEQGKKVLEEVFGLEVVEMPHTLAGSEYVYKHPKERADDFMKAFQDEGIKAIFSCIGGDDSIRLLPYIDFDIIQKNPKIFIGYSDTTISHLMCLKAGLSSFYGPSILAEFAENGGMFEYTKNSIKQTLFESEIVGELEPSLNWSSEYLPWEYKLRHQRRQVVKNEGPKWLQGSGVITGRLFGGCIEVLEMAKGTSLWPSGLNWKEVVLFFETSEDQPDPSFLKYWLRNYGSMGILQQVKGVLFGKPYDERFKEEYEAVIYQVVVEELGLKDLMMVYDLNFGHTSPMMVLPYGGLIEINAELQKISLLEAVVVE